METCFKNFKTEVRFRDLINAVQNCTLCPRLSNRKKVLSFANGNINSKVLFVAEAPGRLGADKTGIPLYGDRTGDNFEALLGNIGWKREDIFITNAILCNPRKENGNNGTPSAAEICNCNYYLAMTIELLQPDVVVALGGTALKAIDRIATHNRILKEHVGKSIPWAHRRLVPLYHPGPRAMIHRPLAKQRADFMVLAKMVDPIKGLLRKKATCKARANKYSEHLAVSSLQEVAYCILQCLGKITYFKLTKLLYLCDLYALEKLGHTLTGEIYLRQQEGPWPPALKKQIPLLDGREIIRSYSRKIPMVEIGPSPRFEIALHNETLEIIYEIAKKYGHLSNSKIKSVVYFSKPMRYILEQEKLGRDMRRVPIIYNNETALELDRPHKPKPTQFQGDLFGPKEG